MCMVILPIFLDFSVISKALKGPNRGFCLFYYKIIIFMGVGRIFSRGALGDFSKIFLGGAKSGKICFFPLETKKATIFC